MLPPLLSAETSDDTAAGQDPERALQDPGRADQDPRRADQALSVLVEVAGLAPWHRGNGIEPVRACEQRLRELFRRATAARREGPGVLEQVRREGRRLLVGHSAPESLEETFRALTVLLGTGSRASDSPEAVCRAADDLDALLRTPSRGGEAGFFSFSLASEIGLPALRAGRAAGRSETGARIDALLALVAGMGDERVHHAYGALAVRMLRQDARTVLAVGGSDTHAGRRLLADMDRSIGFYGIQPMSGTAALATVLFLERTTRPSSPADGGTP
ncbi:triphosphoribosyl-dephospho-CoA synthase [Streptomyces sp. NPDC047974]|uniref:triphosphoribosyl-dephospho-CoA synthase n=1 Tax=Streptomyces sp. NPDC047974 TaxID=3154343 RepID=UPI0033D39940